ncbi:RNA polymerase sigma factor [Paenibacillus faecalis]|uniref:RNA polymerase sigma factor n=1 Tax=Paenibacillus faecalis TaxID=2079532 RepID=UPI000D1058C8|nr:RNA polymerase sigma factor [Paenibacillus faecalis]
MQTDDELIKKIRKGNQSAIEILIQRHYKVVFAYIYRNLGDYHMAYDLTQETFMKMVRNIHSYSNKGSFQYWLLKISLNTCRDYFRSRAYQTASTSSPIDESVLENKLEGHDAIEQKLESNLIRSAIMELPSYQREAIILRYYHDLKIQKIAEITSAGESTVKSRIKQGLSKVKTILERRHET